MVVEVPRLGERERPTGEKAGKKGADRDLDP